MDKRTQKKGFFFPVLLVGLGVLLLLVNLSMISGSARENLALYWPVILMIAGLDGLWRRDGLVWPLLLLGLGVLFQLGNLGYLSVQALPLLSRIWPIVLVAIGIDIAFGRNRGGWHMLLRTGIGLLVVAAIFWLALAYPTGTGRRELNIKQGVEGVQSSRLEISMVSGQMKLTGGAAGGQLLTGKALIPASASILPDYSKSTNGVGRLTLKMDGNSTDWGGNIWANEYDLQLAANLPIDLKTELVAGDLALDLDGTAVTRVESQMAAGNQSISIPCNDGLSVNVEQAVGFLTLNIPQGCAVNIQLDNALVNTSIPAGYQRNGDQISYAPPGTSGAAVEIRIALAVGAVGINTSK